MADLFDQAMDLLDGKDVSSEIKQVKSGAELANWQDMPDPIVLNSPAKGQTPEKTGIAYVKTPDNQIFLLFQDGDKRIAIPHKEFANQFFEYSDNIRAAMDNHVNPLNGEAFLMAQSSDVVKVDGREGTFRLVSMGYDDEVKAFGKPMLGDPKVFATIVPIDTKIGDSVPHSERIIANQGNWGFVMEMNDSTGKMDSLLERRGELSTGFNVEKDGVSLGSQFDLSRLKAEGFEIVTQIPGRPALQSYEQQAPEPLKETFDRARRGVAPSPAPEVAAGPSAQAWFDDNIKGEYGGSLTEASRHVLTYMNEVDRLIGSDSDVSDPALQEKLAKRFELWGENDATKAVLSEYIQQRITLGNDKSRKDHKPDHDDAKREAYRVFKKDAAPSEPADAPARGRFGSAAPAAAQEETMAQMHIVFPNKIISPEIERQFGIKVFAVASGMNQGEFDEATIDSVLAKIEDLESNGEYELPEGYSKILRDMQSGEIDFETAGKRIGGLASQRIGELEMIDKAGQVNTMLQGIVKEYNDPNSPANAARTELERLGLSDQYQGNIADEQLVIAVNTMRTTFESMGVKIEGGDIDISALPAAAQATLKDAVNDFNEINMSAEAASRISIAP